MLNEVVVSSRPDRELKKKLISPGDYSVVPYEDSRCKITITDLNCANEAGQCEIEAESFIFNKDFNGNVLIGDNDFFIDRDFELILQQMCCGETCEARMIYRDGNGVLVKEISCKIELKEVTEEQLISDWSWERLLEASLYHKEKGVELVKQKRITEAFRRFNKALKMVIAIEPMDSKKIDDERAKDLVDVKVKLYNNLAHCQLQYDQSEAALELCNKALQLDPDNIKALYRRSVAYTSMNMIEEAWKDIQKVVKLDPNDKTAQQKAKEIKPKLDKIKKDYGSVIKKMFSK